jgi:hypothetical protein
MSYSSWRRRRAWLRWLLHGLLFASLTAGPGFAEPAASAPTPTTDPASIAGQPKLELANTLQDAGQCIPGTDLTFRFVIKNTGTAPLHLLQVKPHCGCVVASYDNPIPPGGSGVIKAVLDTLSMSHEVHKRIDVQTDDPNNRSLTLTCQATVDPVIEMEPAEGEPLMLDAALSSRSEVTLHSTETIPLVIKRIECTSPCLKARLLPPSTVRERGADPIHDAIVELSAPSGPGAESFTGQVIYHTNSARRPTLKQTVFRIGAPAVAVSPPRLFFGRVAATQAGGLRRVLVLTSQSRPFKVLSAKCGDPHLRLEIPPAGPTTTCEVGVRYLGGWKPGKASGTIRIRTDDPQLPVLVVPFAAEVASERAKPAS